MGHGMIGPHRMVGFLLTLTPLYIYVYGHLGLLSKELICSIGSVFHIANKTKRLILYGFHFSRIPAMNHDDVIKWKPFPRYWPFVRGIHRSLVNSWHKGQWRGTLLFSLICAWINGWVNNRETCGLRRHRAHYDVTVMICVVLGYCWGRQYCTQGHEISNIVASFTTRDLLNQYCITVTS